MNALAVLTSPLGRWAAIGILLIGWTVYQREQAASQARGACQADQLRRTVAEIERQRDAARDALAAAEAQQKKTDAAMQQLEAESARIVDDLKDRAANACVVPPDALERLRNIR